MTVQKISNFKKTPIFLSSAHFCHFELVSFQNGKFHLLQNIKLPTTFSNRNPFSLTGMVPTHWYRLVTQNFQILTPTNCVNFARKEVVQCCTTSDENGGNHVTDNRTGLDTLHVSAFLYTCRITSSHHKIEIQYFKSNLVLTMSAPVLVIFHLHLVTFHSFALCEKQRII